MDRYEFLIIIIAGFFMDQLLGDPEFLYHPVRLIGKLIQFLEHLIRPAVGTSERGLIAGGALLAVLVCLCTGGAAWTLLFLARRLSPVCFYIVSVFTSYQLLAVKSLRTESMNVYRELKKGDLTEARKAVSRIVGRDTERLDMEGVTKAAVETVAENTSDGVIAPFFYLAIGGPVLGWVYKAVNTMDSMIAYKNDRYLYFGRAAAKLDDIMNFIPARLSAVFMIAAAFLFGMDGMQAGRIFLRDRFNHASPNSAQTESVCAGALGVQLAGDAWYFGKRYEKKTIGDRNRAVEPEDIRRANCLLYGTAYLMLAAVICFEIALAVF